MNAHLILIAILIIYPIIIWGIFRRAWVSHGRIRGLCLKFSLLTGSLIYLFGALECYFYNFVAISDGFGQTKMHQNWRERYGVIPTNSLGMRDEEPVQSSKPAMYVVGDSFAAGHGINNYQNRFANILETRLKHQWDLILLAKGGWGTQKQLEVYAEVSNKRDDSQGVLIWQYYINDIDDSGQFVGLTRPSIYLGAPRFLKPIVDNYHFANFLYWGVFRAVYAQELGQQYLAYLDKCFSDQAVWEHHRGQLQQVIDLQHRSEVTTVKEMPADRKLIVVVYPNLKDIPTTRRLSDKVADFFESQGVDVVNIADLLLGYSAEEITVNVFDGHANEMANGVLAEHLYQRFFSSP